MRQLVIVCLAFVVSTSTGWTMDIAVTAHVHTKFSDGNSDVEKVVQDAVSNGGQVLIISDHAEMVNEAYKYYDAYPLWPFDHNYPENPGSKQRILMSSDTTLEDWIQAMGQRYQLPVIPGMECGLGPGHKSHLLFWGGQSEDYRTVVYLEGHAQDEPERTLERLILLAAQKGAVLVQAHPCNSSLFYPFRYQMNPVEGSLFGVEFFNTMSEGEQQDTFERLLEVQSVCDFPVIATGGSDWHGNWDVAADVLYGLGSLASQLNPMAWSAKFILPSREENMVYRPSLARRTIVLADSCSSVDVMAGLRASRCYACFEPGGQRNRILSAAAMPGESFQPTPDNPFFRIRVTRLGDSDPVTLGIVGKDGQTSSRKYNGERFHLAVDGSTLLSVDLRELCSRQVNCGWWLFIMTPRIVTSAIEILPWSETRPETRQEVRQLQAPETEAISQPSPPAQPTQKPAQSDDPMAGCSEVWYGEPVVQHENEFIQAWAGSIPGTDNKRLCLKLNGSVILLVTMTPAPTLTPRCHLWVAKFNPIDLKYDRFSRAELFYHVSLEGEPYPFNLKLFGWPVFPFKDMVRIR